MEEEESAEVNGVRIDVEDNEETERYRRGMGWSGSINKSERAHTGSAQERRARPPLCVHSGPSKKIRPGEKGRKKRISGRTSQNKSRRVDYLPRDGRAHRWKQVAQRWLIKPLTSVGKWIRFPPSLFSGPLRVAPGRGERIRNTRCRSTSWNFCPSLSDP